MSIVEVNQIKKSYGHHQVLKDISFSIKEPQILALVGPNGSGKSTLLNVMTYLLKPDEGRVTLMGLDHKNPEVFKEISYLKDNRVLYPYLTGLDHLQYIQSMQNLPKSRVDEVISRVKIGSYVKKKIKTYSLGMKQHLLIAMAIMNHPKLILMDEPLTGLDPTSVIEVRELIRELFDNKTSILLSSHSLSEIDFITNDILFLKDGVIIQENVSMYQKTIYRIYLNSTNENIHTLLLGDIKIKDNILTFIDENQTIQSILDQLSAHHIKYYKITQKVAGAEARYQALFRDNYETDSV